MGKARMGVAVRDAFKGGKTGSRSADLQKLYQNYQVWCKQIAAMVQALRAHQQSMLHIEKTRTAVSLLCFFFGPSWQVEFLGPWNDYRMTADASVERAPFIGIFRQWIFCLHLFLSGRRVLTFALYVFASFVT